jgi:hypothetical protein
MNELKKIAGLFWILLSIAALWFLWSRALLELHATAVKPDKKIFWYSILPVYTPLMFGLILFGYYALKGEYSNQKIVKS